MYAYIGNLSDGERVPTAWRRESFRARAFRPTNTQYADDVSDQRLAQDNIFPVIMLDVPEGGAIDDMDVIVNAGRPVQTGTVISPVRAESRHHNERKARIAENPALLAAYRAFFGEIQALKDQGIVPAEISFAAIRAALRASDLSKTDQLDAGLEIRTAWDEILVHYDGAMQRARDDIPAALELIKQMAAA